MNNLDQFSVRLSERLSALLMAHGVPGATLVVSSHGERRSFHAGVRSTATCDPIDATTVFEIGSVTKLLTAALVMQLVERGSVTLETAVTAAVPGLVLQDEDPEHPVTVHDLLAHAGGYEGDLMLDTGEDDGALDRYIRSLSDLPRYSTPGTVFSYSNTGYAMLGRLIEVVREVSFDEAVATELAAPLGLSGTFASLVDAPVERRAIGHVPSTDGWTPSNERLPRSTAPAGTRLAATAEDLATFALALIAPDEHGTHILRPATTTAMQMPQPVHVPDLAGQWPRHRGLGWELDRLDGVTLLAHDGDTIGSHAFVRAVPEHEFVLVLLTNGGEARELLDAIMPEALHLLAGGAVLPAHPRAAGSTGPVDAIVGTYSSAAFDWRVDLDESGAPLLHRTPKGLLAGLLDRADLRMEFIHGTTYLAWLDDDPEPRAIAFGDVINGRAGYLHNGRVHPRADLPAD